MNHNEDLAARRRNLLAPLLGEENMAKIDNPIHVPVEVKLEFAQGLVVRPGDKLVISIARRMSSAEYANTQEFFERVIPGVNVIVIPEATGITLIPGSTEITEVTLGTVNSDA